MMQKTRKESGTRLSSKQIKLSSEGAEFMVLGHLLIREINATKAYNNFPGWDVMAFNPETNKSASIQVKSRYATDSIGFLVKNNNFDFLVLAKLNRGHRYTKNKDNKEIHNPDFYIIPSEDVREAFKNPKTSNSMGGHRIDFKHLPKKIEFYENNWNLIRDFLDLK